MNTLRFSFQFAAGKIVELNVDDPHLQGLFPVGPAIERLTYKGLPFTGTLVFDDGSGIKWTLDFVDGLEHGYFRDYFMDFLLAEYCYAFGVQWGTGRERDEDGSVITEETFNFGPKPDHFDPYALCGTQGSQPIRVEFSDPFIQIQQAPDLTVALDCIYYRGRPFTGTLVQRAQKGDWVESEYYMGFIHGSCRAYHLNGQLKSELFYMYDRPYGTQLTWDISGNMVSQLEHGDRPVGPVHIYGRIWNSQGDTLRYRHNPDNLIEFWGYRMLQK